MKTSRKVAEWELVPAPWQCPCPHSLQCRAVSG